METAYIAVDLKTTGLDPKRDKIIEIGAVKIENGKVYINGEELDEPYLQDGVTTNMGNYAFSDLVVPENCVFALGDNRDFSTDSRAFGCIPLEKIEGKVWIRFWPLNLFGEVE